MELVNFNETLKISARRPLRPKNSASAPFLSMIRAGRAPCLRHMMLLSPDDSMS